MEYKVLFLGRHGEGWHNAAESYYGTPAWNVRPLSLTPQTPRSPSTNSTNKQQCYWAELNGNTTTTWYDASLTEKGTAQALLAHSYWQSRITTQHIHTPDKYYVSPLTRTLQTANLTFSGLALPNHSAAFNPLIKELFREGISIHTCDHRHDKSYIQALFPTWPIEPGFTEEDQLWNGVTAETSSAQDERSSKALGQIFFTGGSSKDESFVSVTSHSGEIASILRVIGHRVFSLSTGAVIPALVRAEMVEACAGSGSGSGSSTSAAWTTSAHCTQPPVTSVSGCVCPSSAVPVTTPLVTNV